MNSFMRAFATHKRAKFDYEILETFEAGLVLRGFEVKAIRTGRAKLEGAHIIVRGNEAFVVGLAIAPYQASNTPKNYEPEATRKLLLSKKEIATIEQQTEVSRLTAIPLRLFETQKKIKMEIAIVRGKKKYDKRENIKERDTKRDIDRELKRQY